MANSPSLWAWVVLVILVVGLPASLLAALYIRGESKPAYPDEWDSRVTDLAAFVEDERDLTFKHPVPVDFLTADEYTDQTRADEDELTEQDREDIENQLGMLRALGLASGDVDLFEAGNDLADTGTLAYYDPGEERIVVRGTEVDINLEVTLVHELTHVLQDQHFDLEQDLGEDSYDEDDNTAYARYEAFTALVEGDAMRVENAYLEQLSRDELDEYVGDYSAEVEESEEGLSEVPAALVASQQAPYSFGSSLVGLIAADGGNEAVNDAFEDPPSTSEHMYDPRSYFDGDDPTDLETPGRPVGVDDQISEGEMGAVDLFVLLGDRIDPLVALDATDGWGNARYTTYEQDQRTCVRIAMDGDTTTDDQQLREAFDAWVAASPPESDAVVKQLGDGRTQVESCDPGTDVEATADRALDVLSLPVTRVQVAEGFMTGDDLDEAWGIGDCLMRELTLEQIVAVKEATELSPELQDALDTVLATCTERN